TTWWGRPGRRWSPSWGRPTGRKEPATPAGSTSPWRPRIEGKTMDIGVMVGGSGLAGVVEAVRDVAEAGVGRAWLPQVFGVEALTAIAVAGREVPGIELGTAVVPTYPRHPLVLAGQALTTSAALGGA